MRYKNLRTTLNTALLAVTVLLLGAYSAVAQQVVNLTAGPVNAALPNGSAVPMWGYTCASVTGSAPAGVAATTCARLNPNPSATGWSPIIITVPAGQPLQINLTNNLTFTPAGGTTANNIPTSLVIVGQLGGGLGTAATVTASPAHAAQAVTWPIANTGATNTPPAQGPRVQSMATEVVVGTPQTLIWTAPRPGTYLLESGTHPSIQGPMGLYGIVVVTSAPSGTTAGTAYPAAGSIAAVTYNADVSLLLSEIDPVQNSAVSAAVNKAGFSETAVWSGQPGGCGNPGSLTYQTCYPPAVNYRPLYYLVNGMAFDKSAAANALNSVFGTNAVVSSGSVLVRFVNAGLRMHIPSIVGAMTASPAVSGFSLIAEDGNRLPGIPRVQSEVFMAAGKTYDVMINAWTGAALPVYDRELSLSGNATERDAGMQAYITDAYTQSSLTTAGLGSNLGTLLPAFSTAPTVAANPDIYNSVIPGKTLGITDPSKGVIANDVNVYGVKVSTAPTKGTLTLYADGTFTYVPNAGWSGGDSFMYQANGTGPTALVTLGAAPIEAASGITMGNITYNSNVATTLSIKPPGVLSADKDALGYPLIIAPGSVSAAAGLTLAVDSNGDGGFTASVAAAGTYTFTYKAQNSQGTVSTSSATVTLVFPTASNLTVSVLDGKTKTAITDFRWIIEEDRTFYNNPANTTNTGTAIVPIFGTNFHTSYMPVVAQGCTGSLSCESGQTLLGASTVCDVGNGICRPGTQETITLPSSVHLDPAKRYYISVLPGDAANPFNTANAVGGHGMGGAPIMFPAVNASVTVLAQPTPFPTAKLSIFIFEDDFPLNGEQDGGGGIDILSPNEPGLGGFNITLFDDAGGTGDATGQMTYDMFNMPLSNSLNGTIDPVTGLNACPIAQNASAGITGTIVTCPKYESDGKTLSPLAGQAVVANMMPGRYGVVATPGADRIARGEEWLQTNTLDGQKAHDSFLRIGEPSFFQEYGPAGYHVSIGFANPKTINARLAGVCKGTDPNVTGTGCSNTVTGSVTMERMSRTPDQRLYGSGSYDGFAFTNCFVSFGDPDGEDFAFTKCDANGNFTLKGLPDGDWRITVFDQWNDMLVDGLSTPVRLNHLTPGTGNLGQIAINQWQANIYTRTFFDLNGDGIANKDLSGVPCTGALSPPSCNPNFGNDLEPGLTLVPTNIRFRDGSFSNFNNTDLNGYAGFNEVFPLFNWYVVETDTTRFKSTGTHVVYDAGGPADGTPCGTATTPPTAPCSTSALISKFMANTIEQVSVPTSLRVPGAVYCNNADCTGFSVKNGPASSAAPSSCTTNLTTGAVTCNPALATGRIDPPWVVTEGWQGFSGQNSFLEFGKTPYVAGENGGIRGHVVYASTRPFDDPQLLLQTSWEPLVPGVTINLYREGTAPDGSQSLLLVDTTKTSSWDVWAQGFRSDGMPNMNCPGQMGAPTSTAPGDLFFFTLYNQANFLNPAVSLPNNSQFKCYDGMHNWNQLQPAPYDGLYQFPSVTSRNPLNGAPTGSNCTACVTNPTDGTPMLPAGKYVVEVVVPPGYELVKEEDKNILIGDNYIAPVTQEFAGLGNIFILPDQAEVAGQYNANNSQNPTQNLGRMENLPSHEGDTGSVETFWPCVGALRTVPDYISLFPQSKEVAPFAGALRPLCDRKEVTLVDQTSALAKFYIFTSTHVAAHFTGIITDDFTSEFDPFSPVFGEKFSPPNMPVSIKDWTGAEISRVYSDWWGVYDGLTYSTWEVNPPNPTGYGPTMMITCMNDPGNGPVPDPLFNPAYSQFCYEIPFMPGQTQYMDTPVVPTSAFAGAGYNNPDCSYPDATPAIREVDGDGIGPWVAAGGRTIKIIALGDQFVGDEAYAGPSATLVPFNQKSLTRHYGFGPAPAGGCSNGNPNAACPNVTVGGIPLHGVTWTDSVITGTVQANVPLCSVQQQALYGGSQARCGELVVTTASGKQSIDSITVTIGGKVPTHVLASGSIQSAIDAAAPGDLIIVDPSPNCINSAGATVSCSTAGAVQGASVHNELLLMWKPVRLQGVGAASSTINANTHPAGKLDDWRQRVTCLFGLGTNGSPTTWNASCAAGWAYFNPTANNPQVDRLPLEATIGWDANLNGNLAELLQEPSLMGALEGAGITVLSKGVYFPSNPFDSALFAGFPAGTVLFTSSNTAAYCNGTYPSNFQCNPSGIDGVTITDSSQGGGGIYVHAWGHNLQIANNRIYDNAGTFSGGINVGQGEFPSSYTQGSALNAPPGSCETSTVVGVQLPYCHNMNVNVHNNFVASNSSTGDELFSATPAGAGGVSFATGSDYYQFTNNWLCGNLSTGDGGGLGHIGFSKNGDIEHNWILFNQSTNPTIAANGGGIIVMGAPDVDPPCGLTTDADCVPPLGSVGPSDGIGPGLKINANLIMGNHAESGSGGGIAFQAVNGADVVAFPTTPAQWYSVSVTNNIISNNVAGWDGGGISLLDSLVVNLVNNTIASNDTTASSGVLFNTIGAPLASTQGPCPPGQIDPATGLCRVQVTTSTPQPAGLVSIQNSATLVANFPATITCPVGHSSGAGATSQVNNGDCRKASYPLLYNDAFWQNRAFYIGVGSFGPGTLNQQHIVTLFEGFSTTQVPSQPAADATAANGGGLIITGGTGACVPASGAPNYWDIGVRGDSGPANHGSTVTLNPMYSVLTSTSGYAASNFNGNPDFASQYCNGSRVPPEATCKSATGITIPCGYQVPPGIADATVPNPVFNLTPTATVDEGNNWVNISWGPLSLLNISNGTRNGTILGNYAPATGSSAIGNGTSTAVSTILPPATDFFGAPRTVPYTIGAIQK